MPNPPVDPDSFDKVNYVIDAWTTGCDAPWYIYVETMKPALLAAFITLITFGWDDVLRGYFRPKGLYKRRTGKRKGRWNKAVPRFPELGNELGKNLPGATEVQGKRWSVGTRTLWRVDMVMQQAAFWWLIAGIVEDFAFDWTSLLYESYWCQPDPPGKFSYQTSGRKVVVPIGVTPAQFTIQDYEDAPPSWNVWRGNSGPNGCSATAAVEFFREPPEPPPLVRTVRIASDDQLTVFAESEETGLDPNGGYAAVASGQVPPNTNFRVYLSTDGIWARYGDGVVVAVEIQPT